MKKLNIDNSNITNSQIGSDNSNMIIISESDKEWEQIEDIWKEALQYTSNDAKLHNLVKNAQELTKKRDKVNLKRLVKDFFSEFTKDILSEAAAEVILKFLM